jgi:hypothetical protein
VADLITPDIPLITPDVPVGAIQPDQPTTGAPGTVSSFLANLAHSFVQSGKDVAGIVHPFTDQPVAPPPTDAALALAAGPMQWRNPSAYAAKLGAGVGGAGPMVGGALAGAALGEAVEPIGGGLVGAPIGAFIGSVAQDLAPAYQAARAQGLSHDQAVDAAFKSAAISGGTGALMTVAPIFKLFGTTVEGALKRPISEMLAQTFGVQPAIGTAGAAAQRAIAGQPMTPEQLAETYLTQAGAGAAMVGAHQVVPGLRRLSAAPAGEAPPAAGPETPPAPQPAPQPTAGGPAPDLTPGAVVGIRGPAGPERAQIQRVQDGLIHWVGPDGTPRVDDLAAFQRDITATPPPAEPIRGDATTVGMPPPPPAGEPPITAPDQFAQAFREGPPIPAEAPPPPKPPSPQGAMPLPDTTAIDAAMRAAAVYRVNAEKARIAGSKTPEQITDMERTADHLEAQAQELRAKLAAPRTVPTDVTLPPAPTAALAETLLNRPPAAPGAEPTFGPATLAGQMGELGRNAPAESVATTGQEPVMGTKPKIGELPAQEPVVAPEAPVAPQPQGRPLPAEKTDASLLTFSRRGGLEPTDELKGMDAQSGRGRNALIRRGGQSLDDAVQAAREAGYIGSGAGGGTYMAGEGEVGPGVSDVELKAELLDRMRLELAGTKQYPIGKQGPLPPVDLGREADMREMAAMADERRAMMADLASLGETSYGHLDNDQLKDRLDERLAMTGMDNVADAVRAIQAEEATLNRMIASDAAAKAAINTEDTGGLFHGTGQGGAEAIQPAPGTQAGAGEAPIVPAAGVAEAPAGGNQAPGISAQGGARAPTVETIPTVEGPREHYVIPGMEQSAVQAQAAEAATAAREGKTELGARTTAPQKPADEGLFATGKVPTPTEAVIPGLAGEKTPADPGAVATGIKQVGATFKDMLLDDSGSVPRIEKVLTDAERIAAQVKASKPDSLRGISSIAEHTALAQSVAEGSEEGAHLLTTMQNRDAARHAYQSSAQTAGGAWLRAPEASQTKINKVLEYQTMTNREIPNTGRPVVVHYDAARDFPGRPNPLQIIKDGETVRLTPTESKMLHDMNDFFDRAWKQSAQADAVKFGYTGSFLREGANGRMEFDLPAIQEAIRGANDRGARLAAGRALGFAQTAAQSARQGYFPLMRYGDWTITVTPKVPKNPEGYPLRDEGWFSKVDSKDPFSSLKGAVAGEDLTGTPKRVAQEMAKLRQKFAPADYNMVAAKQHPKTADTVDLAMVSRVLADTKLTDPATGKRLADDIIAKLYEDAKAGYKRPREGVPGYSTDFARAYSDYARQWSNVTAQKLHGNTVQEAYDATQQARDARAARYWNAYFDHNENPQRFGWLYSGMKRVGFFNYLWGSPSSAAIQLTQTPLITGTQLGLLAGHARAQYMAHSVLARAMTAVRPNARTGFALDVKDIGGLTAGERVALQQADREGRLSPVLPTDFAGGQFSPEMRRRFAPAVRVYDMGASMFNTADRANRIAAWVSAYRAAQMPGMAAKAARIYRNDALYREQVGPEMDPTKYANWFTNETQFLSGRQGSSPLMRGPGSVLFQFQHYNTNMMRIMRKNFVKMGPEGKAAFAVMATGLVLGAGPGGLPFVNDAERLANQVGKWVNNEVDPRLDARLHEMIADSGFAHMAAAYFGTDPMHVSEAAMEGLSRPVLGLDLGRRIGLGNILPSNTDLFTAVPFLDATIGKAMEASKRYRSGQPLGAAAALMPAALQNPFKGYESWKTEGINPQSGTEPYFLPSQVTPGMQAARALGFQPAEVARRQEFMNDQNAIKFATDQAAKDAANSLAGVYARQADAQQHGDTAAAAYYAQQGNSLIQQYGAALADPNTPAWEKVPLPTRTALTNRIKLYLSQPGTVNVQRAQKMKQQEMLQSPYLSQ